MAAPTNASFQTAQKAIVAAPRAKLLGLLRNIAQKYEGATASAVTEFSADFPAAGAIDGDATHLNFGPAATAENGLGLSGWKSDSAKTEVIRTSSFTWEGGVKVDVEAIAAFPGEAGNAVVLKHGTSYYQQDFNLLTAAADLTGQDSWTTVSSVGGGAGIRVETVAGFDGKGVRLFATTSGNSRRYRRNFAGAAPTPAEMSFRLKRIAGAGGGVADRMEVLLVDAGGTAMYGIRVMADGLIFVWNGAAYTRTVVKAAMPLNTWSRFVLAWSGAIGAATVRLFFDGKEIHQAAPVNLTGIMNVDLVVSKTAVTTDFYFDEIRIGSGLAAIGTQDNVIDMGAQAFENSRAELTFNGNTARTESLLPGCFYSIEFGNGPVALRDAVARTKTGQTFTPTADVNICSAELGLAITTPVPSFTNVWVEIHATAAGLPLETAAYAKSYKFRLPVFPFSPSSVQMTRFEFPVPFHAMSGVVYALVIRGDYVVGSRYASVESHSAGTYAGGSRFTFDGATWTAQAGDLTFALHGWVQTETAYAVANQDAVGGLRNAAAGGETTGTLFGQGFKVPYDMDAQHVQFHIKKHAAAVLPAGSNLWAEIWSDDGGGKPLAKLVDGVRYDATAVDWTTFRLTTLTLIQPQRLLAATQYHVVARGDWIAHAVNHLDFGTDTSAPSYADGAMTTGDSATPTVWTTQAADMVFTILGPVIPRFRFDVAYSSDNLSYGAFSKITDNPTRTASLSAVAFAGSGVRYWKVRAQPIRFQTGGIDAPPGTELFDYTTKIIYRHAKDLIVTFSGAKTIGCVELYGHPTEGGFRRLELQMNTGAGFVIHTAYQEVFARKKDGAATASSVAGVVTTDGDYLRLMFAVNVAGVTAMKLIIRDSSDEWARILETRAFRVEDWTDRIVDFTVSQQAEVVMSRIMGRTFSVSLRNDDGYLSPKKTAGGYNGEVGAGVRLLPYSGYRDGATLVPQGVFYVDRWEESTADVNVKVTARDGVKIMGTDIQARYKSGYKNWQIIEYLANLAGIPSTDMDLDRTSNTVDYFAPVSTNAYGEAQKVAEAAGFARLYFDLNGYLQFEATGSSSGNPRIEDHFKESVCVYGPPAFLNGKIYFCAADDDLSLSKLCEYDPATSTWRSVFIPHEVFVFAVEIPFVPVVFGQTLYVIEFSLSAPTSFTWISNETSHLAKWNGTFSGVGATDFSTIGSLNAMPLLAGAAELAGLMARASSGSVEPDRPLGVHVQFRDRLYMCVAASTWKNRLWEVNLATGDDVSVAGPGSNKLIQSGAVEGETLVFLTQDVSTGACEAWSFDPDSRAFTLRATLVAAGDQNIPMGLAADGEGHVWTTVGKSNTTYSPKFFRIKISDWTVTAFDEAFSDGKVAQFTHADAVAVADGYVLGATGRTSSNGLFNQATLIARDSKDLVVATSDIGSFSLNSSRLNNFRRIQRDGVWFFYGISDRTSVFEFQIRRQPATQAVAVNTLTDDSGGIYQAGTLDHGDEHGGKSRVINFAAVKSSPLIAFTPQVVWSGDGLPWGVVGGSQLKFQAQLTDPCLPATSIDVVFGSGGAGSFSTSNEIQTPTVTGLITASGRITAASITRSPLRQAGKTVAIAVGEGTSINRYGIRRFTLDNDYIYSAMSLVGLAKSLVSRFGQPKARFTGARTLALWDVAMFDRVTVKDAVLGVNVDVFVIGFSNSFVSQQASLELVEV